MSPVLFSRKKVLYGIQSNVVTHYKSFVINRVDPPFPKNGRDECFVKYRCTTLNNLNPEVER